jgi:hypothetical protein
MWAGRRQADVVGFAVELHQLGVEFGTHRPQGVCSQEVNMSSVKIRRRYFVTKTRWACSSDTLCWARR